MRAASLNVVDDKGIDCSVHKGFREFSREVLAETCLLCWVQGGLSLWVYSLGDDGTGVLGEIGSAFGKMGEGEGKTLVLCWGNGDGALFPVDNWVYHL